MSKKEKTKRGTSRRGFLGLLGLGAAATALGVKPTQAEEPRRDPPKKKKKKKKKGKKKKKNRGHAMKSDMYVRDTDISFFCDKTTERGKIVEAMPGANGLWNEVRPGRYENRPVGLLLNDVVDIDLSRCHLNWSKFETQRGGKVQIMRCGEAIVRPVNGKPIPGAPLFYEKDGTLTTKDVSIQVGNCLSTRDEDDFVKVQIRI